MQLKHAILSSSAKADAKQYLRLCGVVQVGVRVEQQKPGGGWARAVAVRSREPRKVRHSVKRESSRLLESIQQHGNLMRGEARGD